MRHPRRAEIERRRLLPTLAAAVLLFALPGAALAQDDGTGSDGPPAAETDEAPDRRWWNGWSTPSPHGRLYLGAWSAHTFDPNFPDFFANHGLGLQYRGLFAVTFLNSFQERAFAAGAERSWLERDGDRLSAMLGFRAGLLYGYDEKFADIAGSVPVLPFAQPVAMIRLGPVGADVSYIGRAISIVGGFFF